MYAYKTNGHHLLTTKHLTRKMYKHTERIYKMIVVLDGNSGSVSDPVFFPFLLYQFNFNYI
jgi:hypothetical protein